MCTNWCQVQLPNMKHILKLVNGKFGRNRLIIIDLSMQKYRITFSFIQSRLGKFIIQFHDILIKEDTVGKKSIRALEIFRVQKLILNETS